MEPMRTYKPPTDLKRWTLDVPGGELYILSIQDNDQVCAAYGRYAHGSGSSFCTWSEFIGGALNAFVTEQFGEAVLKEARTFIANYRAS